MGTRQKSGGADEAKVPSKSQQNECDKEIRQCHSRQGDNSGACKDQNPKPHNAFNAISCDQMTGEKGWCEHRKNVCRNDVICIIGCEPTPDNGQWSRRHHQIHQGIGDHATDDRHKDPRIAQKLYPAAMRTCRQFLVSFGIVFWQIEEQKQEHPDQV